MSHLWVYSPYNLEKAMAPHSSTLAWKIPWMEEPGGLQSVGSLRVEYDWVTSLSCIGEGNGNPLQCSCLENPRDGGAWLAAVYGVTQSQTRLNRLRSSSSSSPYNSDCVMICSYYLLLRDFWDPLKLRLYMPVDFNVVFNNHYLNWTRNNKLVPNRTRSTSRLYIVTLLI